MAQEAQKLRYRVVIERGIRSLPKRARDIPDEQRQVKRIRRNIIELSSDGEEQTRTLTDMSPISSELRALLDASSDSGLEDDYGDFDELAVADIPELSAESSGTSSGAGGSHNTPSSASGSQEPSTKLDKGKGKEVVPILDLQDELECFICCTPSLLTS